jgi:hypothetical protein
MVTCARVNYPDQHLKGRARIFGFTNAQPRTWHRDRLHDVSVEEQKEEEAQNLMFFLRHVLFIFVFVI